MTIASETNRWAYTGDGANHDFQYTNKIFASGDLAVFVDGALQTEVTEYTVSGVGVTQGGTVSFVTAPANGASVVVVRSVPATQGTDLPLGGAFPSTTVEDSLDKLTVLVQQNADRIARALVLAESDPGTIGTLPDAATRAGAYLAFDGDGNPTVGASLADQAVNYTSDLFSGDGAETEFTLSVSPPGTNSTAVFISGVRQVPIVDYSVSGNTLSFTSAPPAGSDNIHTVIAATFAGVPTDGSVTAAKLAAGAVGTAALADGAVTNTKLSGSAITSAKIAASAVTEAKLAAGLVSLQQPSISGCVPSSGADSDHDIAFTAGKCINADGDQVLVLPAYTKQFDVAFAEGDAAGGGGDGVSLPTSGTFYLFSITKDADGTVDYFGDTSSSGANVPSGWTVEREVFRLVTGASANILPLDAHEKAGGAVSVQYRDPPLDVDDSVTAGVAETGTLTVPSGRSVEAVINANINANGAFYINSLAADDETISRTAGPLSTSGGSGAGDAYYTSAQVQVRLNASAQFRYRSTSTCTIKIATLGWTDERIV